MTQRGLFEQVMGPDFSELHTAVQRFHRLSGRHALAGWVETQAPTNPLAKLLAWYLGSPRQAASGPIRLELDVGRDAETWARHFPSQTMRSALRRHGHFIEERLGGSRLQFGLRANEPGLLTMELKSMGFLGIPCPRWWLPSIVAEERGEEERLYFKVRATLPVIGLLAHYQGHLTLTSETVP